VSAPVRYARYGAAGFDLFGTIIAGTAIGYFLDKWLATAPYLTLVMMLLAIVGGFIRLIRTLRHFDQLDDERNP
jgi:ATP synthase protein I